MSYFEEPIEEPTAMPIVVECPDCGTKMRAPDGSEGRKAKCPGCQKLLTITAARPEEPEEPPAPPPSRRRRDEEEEAPSRRGVQEGRSRRRDEDEEDEEERRSPAARRRRDEEDERPSRRRRDEDDERPSRRRRRDDEYEDDRPGRRPRFSRGYDPGQPGFSMTSMILGITSVPMTLCCWPIGVPIAILAIIFGLLGMNKGGKNMGVAGLILGAVSLLLLILVLALNIGMRTASSNW